MTDFSVDLCRYPTGTAPDDLAKSWTECTRVMSLDHFAPRLGPYTVADWATANGLPRHWVDGAWVRVPMTRAEARRFACEVLGADGETADRIASRIDDGDGIYVISAEEF